MSFGPGFGAISPDELHALRDTMARNRLRKAVEAGYNTPGVSSEMGGTLVPQSLEQTLASATFQAQDCVAWRSFPKTDVQATVSEFTRIEEHGNSDVDPWFAEGGKPASVQSRYTRDFTKIKYLGVEGSVTFPMMHSRIIGSSPNAEAEEATRKTLHLLGMMERAIYFGDSKMDTLAFDGLSKLIPAANIHDLRNQPLTGKVMREDMSFQRDLNAMPNLVLMSNASRMIIGNLGEHNIRRPVLPGQSGAGQRVGMTAVGVEADHGFVPFESTIFLKARGGATLGSFGPTGLELTFTGGTQPEVVALGAGEKSNFVSDDKGHYRYVYVGVGISDDKMFVTPPLVAADADGELVGNADKEKIRAVVVAPIGTKYIRVYRQFKAGTADTANPPVELTQEYLDGAKFAFDVATRSGANAGTALTSVTAVTIDDLNKDIPGTTWSFSLQMTPDVVEIVRLLDLMKLDLALIDTTKKFLLILFASLRSRTPSKLWAWRNCSVLHGAPEFGDF